MRCGLHQNGMTIVWCSFFISFSGDCILNILMNSYIVFHPQHVNYFVPGMFLWLVYICLGRRD